MMDFVGSSISKTTKALVLVLLLVGCSFDSSSLSEEFESDRTLFKRVVSDVRLRYHDYSNYFSVKMADDSFQLSSKIMRERDMLPVSFSGQFLLNRKDIEITVLDSNTIWFRRELSNSFFKIESELLLYSEKNKAYLDSVLCHRYSAKSGMQTLEDKWYFVNVTRHID